MVQTRLGYGLSDLPLPDTRDFSVLFGRLAPEQIGVANDDLGARGFAYAPQTLVSIGPSWLPAFGNDVRDYPGLIGSEGPDTRPDFVGGPIQTALQGGAIGDTARSSPSLTLKVSDDEIEPLRPGRRVRRKPLDAKPAEKHLWHPIDFDLPRFDPPKGVPDRITKLVNTPGLEDQMIEKIREGLIMMNDADWHDTTFLRDRFVKRHGEDLGTREVMQLIDLIGATSPLSDVGTNIRNAAFYFNKIRRGEPLPSSSKLNPPPYDHRIGGQHLRLIGIILALGALHPLIYPKITSFTENLKGNQLPVTVDVHALRLPAMLARAADFLKREYREKFESGELSMDEAVANPSYWRGPYPNEVAVLEQFYKRLARRTNLLPSRTQGAAWIGGSRLTGVRTNGLFTFKDHFEDRIRRTAKKLGLTEEEVWDGFIDGDLDLVLHDDQVNSVA